ncbi:MAG: hypothetical protein RSF90_01615 [Pygmaiobacter sp.]
MPEKPRYMPLDNKAETVWMMRAKLTVYDCTYSNAMEEYLFCDTNSTIMRHGVATDNRKVASADACYRVQTKTALAKTTLLCIMKLSVGESISFCKRFRPAGWLKRPGVGTFDQHFLS